MRTNRPGSGWSPSSLARGLLIGAITLAMAGAAFANAIVNVTRTINPALALAMPYTDAVALAASADQQVTADPSKLKLPVVGQFARNSLIGQALNPRALRLLGYVAGEKGDVALAGRLIRLSERASRREVSAQFWLIEDCVGRGDVSCSIEHYDIAMRTEPTTRPLLIPVLAGALDEPEVRRALALRLRPNPQWQYDFVHQATASLKQPSQLSETLIAAGGLPGDPVYRQLETDLLGKLVANNEFAEAHRYLTFLSGDAAKDFAVAGFNPSSVDPRFSPLSWQTISTSNASAEFERTDGRQAFALHLLVGASERATVARRIVFLAPGIYRLSDRQTGQPLTRDSVLTWSLSCAATSDRRIFWSASTLRSRSDISITDAACPAYMLELNAAAGSGSEGLDVTVTDLNLRRIR